MLAEQSYFDLWVNKCLTEYFSKYILCNLHQFKRRNGCIQSKKVALTVLCELLKWSLRSRIFPEAIHLLPTDKQFKQEQAARVCFWYFYFYSESSATARKSFAMQKTGFVRRRKCDIIFIVNKILFTCCYLNYCQCKHNTQQNTFECINIFFNAPEAA